MNKKMVKFIMFFLLSVVMLNGKVFAAEVPPVGYEHLSKEEKAKAQKLEEELMTDWASYVKALTEKAEANCKSGDYDCTKANVPFIKDFDEALSDAANSSAASKHSKAFEEKANTLWNKYGVLIKVHYQDGGGDDVCNENNWYKVGDQSECEGPMTAGDYSTWGYAMGNFKAGSSYAPQRTTPPGPKPKDDGAITTIASAGLFTDVKTNEYGACNIKEVKESFTKDKIGDKANPNKIEKPAVKTANNKDANGADKPPFTWDSAVDKIGNSLGDTFKAMTNDIHGTIFGTDCDNNSLSVVSQFLNVSRPLNLTDNQYIMKLVHITQQIAFTLTVVLIAFYAIMYTTGFQNMDPVKFGVRLFFCLLAVNYLPWLMQDILNLNNLLVYNVSTITFDFGGVEGNSTDILMGAFTAIFESLINGVSVGESILFLLFIIVVAILAIMPMLRIIMWWYVRLLRIFLGAIVGPILIMFAALPQTAKMAQNWVKSYIGQVFEQVFMALGLIMVAVILGNIGDFGTIIGVGWFGKALLVYAAIFFLADVPSFAGSFLSSFSGGSAGDMANGVKSATQKNWKRGKHYGGKALDGAGAVASAGAATALGGIGLAAGAKRALTGSANSKMTQKILGKSKWAQKGSKAGFRTAGAAKNTATGFSMGAAGAGRNSGNAWGKAGTVGSHAGAAVNATGRGVQKAQQVGGDLAKKTGTSVKNKLADAKTSAQVNMGMANVMASHVLKNGNLKTTVQGAVNKAKKKVENAAKPTMDNIYNKTVYEPLNEAFKNTNKKPPSGNRDGNGGKDK